MAVHQTGTCVFLSNANVSESLRDGRYEIRTNNLFSDRAEHAFYTKDSNAGLPNLRPDRTCGLRETGTIRDFFDQPQRAPENSRVQSIRDLLETSPFKQHPLHFPFLVIEAKSGTAQESFADIQTQTALPLQQLLNLQSSLWKYRMSDASGPAPLVWFLAYKGSDWKIYACYMSEGERSRSNYVSHCIFMVQRYSKAHVNTSTFNIFKVAI